MEGTFEEVLLGDDTEKLNDLKRWLFEENIKLAIRQKELDEFHNRFMEERKQFQEEMKSINLKVVRERSRLKDEETFFDKKMQILKNGFEQLEIDRKKLEKEKIQWQTEQKVHKDIQNESVYTNLAHSFFAGVNNPLALRKRYRDLLKIFHPDNLCGDTEMVTIITKEYEQLKSDIDYPYKTVNR